MSAVFASERLLVTLRSIGDGVIATDTHGRVVIMNAVAERLTGWSQAEAEGRFLHEVFAIVREVTRQPCANPVERVLSSNATVELANHTVLVARNGTERVIGDSGAPIMDQGGRSVDVVLVSRDMTEKVRLLESAARSQKLEALGEVPPRRRNESSEMGHESKRCYLDRRCTVGPHLLEVEPRVVSVDDCQAVGGQERTQDVLAQCEPSCEVSVPTRLDHDP